MPRSMTARCGTVREQIGAFSSHAILWPEKMIRRPDDGHNQSLFYKVLHWAPFETESENWGSLEFMNFLYF